VSMSAYELEAYPEWEEELEEEYEGEQEGEEEGEEFLGALGSIAKGLLGEEEWEEEGEVELEEEDEGEYEANPLLRVYPDALMEHLGHAATEAESEAEAEAFIGALVPLAARLIPKVAPALMKAAPRMISQAGKVARVLRKSPVTKPLVRAIPNIMKRTTQSLADQAARGKVITPQTAVRTLQRQTLRVLRNPGNRTKALRHARVADRRFHRLPGNARMIRRTPVGPRGTGARTRSAGAGRRPVRYRPGYGRGYPPGVRYRRRPRPPASYGYGPPAMASGAPAGYAPPGPAYDPAYGPWADGGGSCPCCGQPVD
jgi:hypothetical protein